MTRERYRHEKSTAKPGTTFEDLQTLITQMAFDGVPNDAHVHELKIGTFGMRLEVNWTTVVGEPDAVEPRGEDEEDEEDEWEVRARSARHQFLNTAFMGIPTGQPLSEQEILERSGWDRDTPLSDYLERLVERGHLHVVGGVPGIKRYARGSAQG